uniref:Uncharacterized protein n=1 Tax=Triticum urartu TaxID=4572 RepID=A0A8R7QEX3_TRIUA
PAGEPELQAHPAGRSAPEAVVPEHISGGIARLLLHRISLRPTRSAPSPTACSASRPPSWACSFLLPPKHSVCLAGISSTECSV